LGNDLILVGCSTSSRDDSYQDTGEGMITLQKWFVDVKCEGCRGLFYRSEPNVIVPDADWPRNGDVVVGSEIPDTPGWIRLQNGYYLPMHSDDKKIQFLHKVSTRTTPSNPEKKRVGSATPLFRSTENETIANLKTFLESETSNISVEEGKSDPQGLDSSGQNVRAAIHMDAMAFGMGCCCLQITFQAKDMDESRFMYDQLAVMAPIMMALTASTPLLRGRIADTDTRWGIISESVDDRTLAERGLPDPSTPHDALAGKGQRRMYKSRYDCISTYIYQGAFFPGEEPVGDKNGLANRVLNIYNDIPVPIEEESYRLLREAGIDPALSQHVAHLFIRDPLVVFNGAVEEVDDETQTNHWESIQSTNWQTVRWKPPPPRNSPNDPHIGWRTEFRSMELQLTDYENAAFTAFIVLLTRVILAFDLNLYIPISRVDANMQRAHSRNASAKGKFFFRRHMAPLQEGDNGYGVQYTSMFSSEAEGVSEAENSYSRFGDDVDHDGVSRQRRTAPFAPGSDEENSYEEMTMAEIMCGKDDYFPGLIPLVQAYLDHINCDSITRRRIDSYLDFITRKATGELMTTATWIRQFVKCHPAYKADSVVTDAIAYDLVKTCTDVGLGKVHLPEVIGNVRIDPVTEEGAYETKLDSRRAQNTRIVELLKRYKTRGHFNKSVSKTLSKAGPM
jgi:glutamate--cysteine ligase catalytic subunit